MPSEIDDLRALLGAKPRPTSWAERRSRLDEVATVDAPPADVAFTPVEIGGIPAEWSQAPGVDADRVMLLLHGGGYCSGSIRSHRTMAAAIGRAAGMRVLALGYRLAPEHPFPAALDDALSAWHYLRSEGFAAQRIAIGGDSAGGGLTLACIQRLRDAGEPLPGCAWLVSPWTDLTMSGASMADKDAADPLIHRAYLDSLAQAYLAGHDPRDALVSPLFADLAGLPPVLIQVGSAETLLDDAARLARALGVADVPVRLEVWPQMVHAWVLWSARLTDGRRACEAAGEFLRARTSDVPEIARLDREHP